MTREDVLKVVAHTGDCYRLKCRNVDTPFNFYVSRIGAYGMEQDAGDLPYKFVSYNSIEWVERY